MKKLTIATVITTLILSACAASPSYAASEEVLMNCKQVHEAATITMQLRQDGVAYPDMLDIASDSSMLTVMVHSAFERDRAMSDTYRLQITQDFANLWFTVCTRNGGRL